MNQEEMENEFDKVTDWEEAEVVDGEPIEKIFDKVTWSTQKREI